MTRQQPPPESATTAAVLLGVLLPAFQRCAQQPADAGGEALVVDGTVGVHLGLGRAWIAGARTSGEPESIAVAAFVVAVAAIVLLTTLTLRRRYHPRRAI